MSIINCNFQLHTFHYIHLYHEIISCHDSQSAPSLVSRDIRWWLIVIIAVAISDDRPVRDGERRAALMHFTTDQVSVPQMSVDNNNSYLHMRSRIFPVLALLRDCVESMHREVGLWLIEVLVLCQAAAMDEHKENRPSHHHQTEKWKLRVCVYVNGWHFLVLFRGGAVPRQHLVSSLGRRPTGLCLCLFFVCPGFKISACPFVLDKCFLTWDG